MPDADKTYLKMEQITEHKYLRYWPGEQNERSIHSSMLAVPKSGVRFTAKTTAKKKRVNVT